MQKSFRGKKSQATGRDIPASGVTSETFFVDTWFICPWKKVKNYKADSGHLIPDHVLLGSLVWQPSIKPAGAALFANMRAWCPPPMLRMVYDTLDPMYAMVRIRGWIDQEKLDRLRQAFKNIKGMDLPNSGKMVYTVPEKQIETGIKFLREILA